MTDPLSIAAGVAGLIGVASELTQACYGYYKKAKNAPSTVQDVISEIKLLRKALSDLEDICDRRTEPLPTLEPFVEELSACEEKIAQFGLKIDNDFRNPQRLIKRLEWPFRDPEIRLFLAQLQRYRTVFESAKTNAILEAVLDVRSEMKSEAAQQDSVRKAERRKAILDWLSPLDFRDQQQEYYKVRRQPGTSEWVENEPSFNQWRDGKLVCNSPRQVLWCTGSPGSGKTICCSVLIHRLSLMSGRVAVAYVYINSQERGIQTPENIVGSLIKQIVSSNVNDGRLPSFVEEYYDANSGSGRPRLVGLSSVLNLACRSFSKVFLVVDGFDEFGDDTQQVMIAASKLFFKQSSARLMISSRSHTARLGWYLASAFALKITGNATDIRKFVKSRIKENYKLQMILAGDSSLTERVAEDVSGRSQGQFTIATMHLRKISEATNKAALLNLEYLPTTLKQYYEEAMDRIRKQPVSHLELARRGLGLMCHAKDSLTTKELQEGLCIATGDHNLDISRLTPFPIILNACLGFVSNDNPSEIVEFFHATFREWLLSSRVLWSELDFDIGEICLTYLMLEDFSQPCESEELIVARRQQYPFGAYASRFWADHIRGKGESDHSEILLNFLSSSNLISSVQILPEAASRDTRLIGQPREWLAVAQSNSVIAVYFCICLNLQRTLDLVLQRNFGPLFVVPWGENYSPLHVALIMRAGDVCSKLIKKGIWTDVRDRHGMTPLHLVLEFSGSSLTSHALQLMRDAKARIDIPDSEGRTAFHYAIRANNASAADYMLKNYTSLGPNFWNVEGNTPLHEAVAREQHSSWMIELLLKNKFSPMVPNREGKTALAIVVERGNYSARPIVEKILGAADAANAAFKIPEQERSAAEAFLKSLSDQEAQARKSAAKASLSIAEQQIRFGGRLGHLETASERGSIKRLVSLLLKDPKLDKVNPGSGMTPLHHAVLGNQEEATWHLLAAGADPNLKNSNGLSAIEMADKDGRKAILTLFADDQPWLDMEKPVGEGPFPRKISGRELRDVYEYGRQVEQMRREHHSGSWSYRGTNWSEYLGFRGVYGGWE